MVQKTKVITSGATFIVPIDFISAVKIHAISAGEDGYANSRGGIGGTHISIDDFGGFSIGPGDELQVQIGQSYITTGVDYSAAETWIKDAADTLMLLAPAGYWGWNGANGDPEGAAVPYVIPGGFTSNPPFPNDGSVSWGGSYNGASAGAAGGPRKFVDGPSGSSHGSAGGNSGASKGGGGAAIADPAGSGWPQISGSCDSSFPVGGDGCDNDLGAGGGTIGTPNGTNGGGGRGGDSPYEGDGGTVFDGGDGSGVQLWQDSDTLLWYGPGSGAGGGGGTGSTGGLGNGGNGGSYGGGGGGSGSDDASAGSGAPGVLIFIYESSGEEDIDVCENLTGFTDEDLPQIEAACDWEWPFDVLKPQAIGIYPVQATLGGGPTLAGNEETEVAEDPAAFPGNSPAPTPSIAGFWRISYGGIPLRTLAQVRKWREGQTILNGRSGVCCVHLYDGKRAPWPSPLAAITAEADGSMAVGDDAGDIRVTGGSALLPGMHFSAEERAYRLVTVDAPSGDPPVYPVTFWPRVRKAIADGDPLEFAHPICRMRLAKDDGMNVKLDLMRFATPSVDWVEDI